MEDVRAIKAKRLAGAEDQQLQRFIFLHFHDYRQYPSDCEIVKNYLATWHPDTSSSRVSLRISRLRLRSSLLAFRQKSHYPKSFASELVATTTIPFLKTQAEYSHLLDRLNKIMAESSTRAWWLPIIEERIRQNTINQASKIKVSHRGLDTGTIQMLRNLIDEGKIDADLLHALIPSSGPLLSLAESPGVDSSSMDRAGLDSQQSLPNLADKGSSAQSSHDAPIASPSKKYLKNQRKKDRKRANLLAANQDPTQGSPPEDPTNTTANAADISKAPDHLEDHTGARS